MRGLSRGYYDGTLSGGQGTSGGKQDSWSDSGRGNQGGYADPGTPTRGTIGLHTLLNANVSNVKAYLYGRAGFLTSEPVQQEFAGLHGARAPGGNHRRGRARYFSRG